MLNYTISHSVKKGRGVLARLEACHTPSTDDFKTKHPETVDISFSVNSPRLAYLRSMYPLQCNYKCQEKMELY